jgi:hypothetical protein
VEEGENHDLVRGQLCVLSLELLRDLGVDHLDEIAGHIGAQDLRMDVALAADGRRSRYPTGQSRGWVKVTCAQRETLTIAGFSLDGTKWDGIYIVERATS